MLQPKHLSIRQKILLIGLLPACAGLALSCAMFILAERREFRTHYTERLTAMADVIARGTGPALAAGDRDEGARIVETLAADSRLLSAVIHDQSGRLFAGSSFGRGPLPGTVTNGDEKSISLFRPVRVDGRSLGSVHLRASVEPLNEMLARNAWMTLFVLLGAGGLALGTAVRLRRWITQPVSELSERMREIAEGDADLTRHIEIDQDDEMGQLAHWFNHYIDVQRQRIARLAGNSRLLGAASDQLATISEQMSTNADETSGQASVVSSASEKVSANLQKVAAASEQLHGGAREIASHVSNSVHVADKAVREATGTSDTLARLTTSSDEIGAVVKVINSIAEQTNLLALNATIEAARAGELGKGFGVVASEVKELARGTANATEDIARRIQAIQDDTRSAVAAIERIVKVIHHIRGIQKEIATAMEEQTITTNDIGKNVLEAAHSSADISGSIVGVAEAARMTANGVRETRRAAGELSEMAADLERLVSRFVFERPERAIAEEIVQAPHDPHPAEMEAWTSSSASS